MNKHADGPWVDAGNGDILDANGQDVCSVYIRIDDSDEANAKLIAAAPYLLVAISYLINKGRALRETIVETRGVRGMDEHDIALREAMDAIAKATRP